MRSIIDGIPPRSGNRIFSEMRTSVRTRNEPADFFSGGVVQPNTAQLASLDRSPSSNPLSLAVCGVAFFSSNPLGWWVCVSGRVLLKFIRVSWVGCWCLISAENGERPPNSGGEFRRALLPRGGVLGLVVGWWYFAARGVGA